MAWFEELGFSENPLDASLEASAKYAVGLETQLGELEYFVASGSLVFVEGPAGSGKSVLLWKLAKSFGGRAVYADCSSGDLDIRSLVKKKASFVDRLLGKAPKGVVLLLDNVAKSRLSSASVELLKYYFDNNHVGAAVFAGPGLASAGLPPSIVDRIGRRVLSLPAFGEDEAVLMVRNRLGSNGILQGILAEGVVRRLYRMTGKNTAQLLQLCEGLCKVAVASNLSAVTDEHINQLKLSLADNLAKDKVI